jgi:hypothetical protein
MNEDPQIEMFGTLRAALSLFDDRTRRALASKTPHNGVREQRDGPEAAAAGSVGEVAGEPTSVVTAAMTVRPDASPEGRFGN